MVVRRQLEVDAVFFILIGAAVGFGFILIQNYQRHGAPIIISPQEAPAATPTPTPILLAKPTTSSQISSDGTQKVTLTTTPNQDGTQNYKISTGDNGTVIYSKTLNADENISVPFNTWSADNRYFFIQENTKAGPSVLVFTANGEPFGDGEKYLDLTDVFKQRDGKSFDQVTGWAEGHLIVINTKLDDGTQGNSYWFEVPSKALIPLAVKF